MTYSQRGGAPSAMARIGGEAAKRVQGSREEGDESLGMLAGGRVTGAGRGFV